MKPPTLLFAIASVSFPSYAIDLTPIHSTLSCPDLDNMRECAIRMESRLSARLPNVFSIAPGVITIRMMDETSRKLNNVDELLNIVDISPDKRFLAVREQFYEGNTWYVFDRKTGDLTRINGYPLFSPDNLRFVAIEQDLDAGYSPNRMAVYRVTDNSVEEEFDLIPKDAYWGPGNTTWIDNETIRFEMVWLDDSASSGDPYLSKFCLATRIGQGWRVTACDDYPE